MGPCRFLEGAAPGLAMKNSNSCCSYAVRLAALVVFLAVFFSPAFFWLFDHHAFSSSLKQPAVFATLSKNEFPVGEEVTLTVRMEWEQSGSKTIRLVSTTPPASELLELVDTREDTSSRLTEFGFLGTRSIYYVFKAVRTGTGTLSPVSFEYVDPDRQEEKEMVRGEAISFRVISRAEWFLKKLLWMALGSAALVLAGGLVFLLRKLRIFPRAPLKKEGSINDVRFEQGALRRIGELRAHQVAGDFSKLYAELKILLADYVKSKYGTELTHDDHDVAVRALRNAGVAEELARLCEEALRMTDKVRFGGHVPSPDELGRLIRSAEKYFKNLIPRENEEAAVETVD